MGVTDKELAALRQQGDTRTYAFDDASGTYSPPPTVDIGGYLQSRGLEFRGFNEDGSLKVFSAAKNTEGVFDLTGALKQKGLDPSSADIRINTPQTALPISPLSAAERAKWATFGDTKTFASELRKQFEDVVLPTHENGLDGIVVKKNGAYHKVDPGFFEGFSASELGKDLAELAPAAAVAGLGTAAALTGGAALIPAALFGGGGAMALRTSLGRIAGTYNSTPMEELEDIGVEALANLAGEKIAAGGALSPPQMMRGMAKAAARMSDGAKETWATTIGFMTRAGREAAERTIERYPQVAGKIRDTFKALGPRAGVDDVIETLADEKVESGKQLLRLAVQTRPQLYKQALDKLATVADGQKITAQPGEAVRAGFKAIEDEGLGKFTSETTGTLFDRETGKMVEETFGGGDLRLVPLSEPEKASRGSAERLPEVFPYLQRMVTTLKRYAEDGELEGKNAVHRLAALNRAINNVAGDAHDSKVPGAAEAVEKVAAAVRGHITKQFDDVGLGGHWADVNAPYKEFSEFVDNAKSILNSREGAYTFVERLTKMAGKRGSAAKTAKELVEMIGPEGQALYDKILDINAAMKFAPKAPQLGLANVTAASGVGGLIYSRPVLQAAATIGTLGAASPRANLNVIGAARWAKGMTDDVAGRMLPFARKFGEFVKSADQQTHAELLRSPAVIGQLVKGMATGIETEEDAKQQLTDWAQQHLGK